MGRDGQQVRTKCIVVGTRKYGLGWATALNQNPPLLLFMQIPPVLLNALPYPPHSSLCHGLAVSGALSGLRNRLIWVGPATLCRQ